MNNRQLLELAKTVPGATSRFGWTNCPEEYDIPGLAARTGRVAQVATGLDKGRHLYEVELLIEHSSGDAQVARYRSGGAFFWANSTSCPRLRITLDPNG